MIPHNSLYSKGYIFQERLIKDLWNSLWTTRNSSWSTLRIVGAEDSVRHIVFLLPYEPL